MRDHVQPLSRGGQNTRENLRATDGSCNKSPKAPLVRYRSIIGGGTPSLTYSVSSVYLQNPDGA